MFRRLFGKGESNSSSRDDVVLHLKFEPIPANAPAFAKGIVDSTRGIVGMELDYTPDSLAAAGTIIEGFRADHLTSRDMGETLFGFGCYLGEVFVRHAGGRWRLTEGRRCAARPVMHS